MQAKQKQNTENEEDEQPKQYLHTTSVITMNTMLQRNFGVKGWSGCEKMLRIFQ